MRRGELALQCPQTTVYGASADEAQRFGLPCGGTVKIVLEPLAAHSRLGELLAAVEQGRVLRRRLELASGAVTLEARDAFGNVAPLAADTAVTLAAAPASGLAFHAGAGCGGAPVGAAWPVEPTTFCCEQPW